MCWPIGRESLDIYEGEKTSLQMRLLRPHQHDVPLVSVNQSSEPKKHIVQSLCG
jgi:hypothetical protein